MTVERVTGVSREDIQSAARLFAEEQPGSILYALGNTSQAPLRRVLTCACQSRARNRELARPSSGLYPLFTGANEQGARDVGCVPDLLPGYRHPNDDGHRKQVSDAWNSDIPSSPGIGVRELAGPWTPGSSKQFTFWGQPEFHHGELGHFKAALSNAEFVVAHATFENDVTELADVVLPSQTFAERSGTYTNLERRVQLLRPALGPKGDEEADWRIISQIASRMDADGFSYKDESEIFDELNNLISIYGGITYGRIQAGGIHWPCLATDMADVAILYQESRTESKLKLAPMSMGDVPVHEDDEYPLMLAHGRVLHQPDEDMEIIQINGRNAIQRDETIMLHPEDAAQLGIEEGDWVEAISGRGRAAGIADLTGPQRGLVSITTLFGDLITGLVQSEDPDPMLNVPTLPLTPVRIVKLTAQVAAD